MNSHFLYTSDLSSSAFSGLVEAGLQGKSDSRHFGQPLAGKSVALVFFNASLRTRTSMAVAVNSLGGFPVILDVSGGVWNLEVEDGVTMLGDKPEHIKEAIPVISRYVDLIGVRCFPKMESYETDRTDPVLSEISKYSEVPVINLESAIHHPCQAVADMMTIREKLGEVKNKKILLTWAPHPKPLPQAVPNSFALAACQMGADLVVASPEGFELDPSFMASWRQIAIDNGGSLTQTNDQNLGLDGAEVVYAKSWGSISCWGNADKDKSLRSSLGDWMVSMADMERTRKALFMHCLPVRRNVVVADEVLDSPYSCVVDQAENRLHGQKAIINHLMGDT